MSPTPKHSDLRTRLIELSNDETMEGHYVSWSTPKRFFGFGWAATEDGPLEVTHEVSRARSLWFFGFSVSAVADDVNTQLQISSFSPYRLARRDDLGVDRSPLAASECWLGVRSGQMYTRRVEFEISRDGGGRGDGPADAHFEVSGVVVHSEPQPLGVKSLYLLDGG
jgi:hypothetical protein